MNKINTEEERQDFKTLSSLAFLSVFANEGVDYLQYFEPFIGTAIARSNKFEVSISEVKELVRDDSGFLLPGHVIKIILRRLVSKGVLESTNQDNRYSVHADDADSIEIISERRNFERKISIIIKQLTVHAQDLGITEWTDARSESALFDLIDEFSRPLLDSAVFGVPLALDENSENEARYVFATFANKLESSEPSLFQTFIEIVKGSMAANAVLFRNPSRVRARVNDLKLFLDTGFILRLLGYEGDEQKALTLECVRVARNSGAKLRIFSHTLDEAQIVIRGVADRLMTPSSNGLPQGGVFHFARQKNWAPSDLRRFALGLESDLKKVGVHQEDFSYDNYMPSYSEVELEEHLQQHVRFHEDSTRQRDLRSIAGIMRIRGSLNYSDIENSKAMFVTTNDVLMGACLRFFGKGDLVNKVPVVITSEFLTNLLWLKDPDVGSDLPRAKVIANIASGLTISTTAWKRYLSTVDRLAEDHRLSPDEVTLLRYSSMAPKEIMEISKGREDTINDTAVEKVLLRIEKAVAGEAAEKLLKLEKSIDGPRERLLVVLKLISILPSLILIILFSTIILYISVNYGISKRIELMCFSVIPSIPVYIWFSKFINTRFMSFLRKSFVSEND